jgi:hypothetical protein
MEALFAGAFVSLEMIFSPARVSAFTSSGERFLRTFFWAELAAASIRL